MASISDLFNLQKVDYNVIKIRQRFQQIQKALGGNEELKKAQEVMNSAESTLTEWQNRQKECELESQSLSSRIKQTDAQLMSGSVTNHKELEALQASLESLRRQKDTIETQSVEAMEQIEILTAQFSEVKGKYETIETTWNERSTSLKNDGKKLQQQFQLLKQKRESLIQSLDKDSLTLYDELRKRKGGVAVAPLKGDTCGACNMQVPSGVISAARVSETDPVYCPSCGRILYSN